MGRVVLDPKFCFMFPISRDPPEGGTIEGLNDPFSGKLFPISRDPPEGGTCRTYPISGYSSQSVSNF